MTWMVWSLVIVLAVILTLGFVTWAGSAWENEEKQRQHEWRLARLQAGKWHGDKE